MTGDDTEYLSVEDYTGPKKHCINNPTEVGFSEYYIPKEIWNQKSGLTLKNQLYSIEMVDDDTEFLSTNDYTSSKDVCSSNCTEVEFSKYYISEKIWDQKPGLLSQNELHSTEMLDDTEFITPQESILPEDVCACDSADVKLPEYFVSEEIWDEKHGVLSKNDMRSEELVDDAEFISTEEIVVLEDACDSTEVEFSKYHVSGDIWDAELISGKILSFLTDMRDDDLLDTAKDFDASEDLYKTCDFIEVQQPGYFVSEGQCQLAERGLLSTFESSETVDLHSTEKYEIPQEKCDFLDVEPSKYSIPVDIWKSISLPKSPVFATEVSNEEESAEDIETPEMTSTCSEVGYLQTAIADIADELEVHFREETPEEREEREREEKVRLERQIRENEERIERALRERKERDKKEREERIEKQRLEREAMQKMSQEDKRLRRREERERQEREEKENREREERDKRQREEILRNRRDAKQTYETTESFSSDEITVPEDVCDWIDVAIPEYFISEDIWDEKFGLISKKILVFSENVVGDKKFDSIKDFNVDYSEDVCGFIEVQLSEYFVSKGSCQLGELGLMLTTESSETTEPESTENVDKIPQDKCNFIAMEFSKYLIPANIWKSILLKKLPTLVSEVLDHYEAESAETVKSTQMICDFSEVESKAVIADIADEIEVNFREETPEEREEREKEEQELLERQIREHEERLERELKEKREKERKEKEERIERQRKERVEMEKIIMEEKRVRRREERERQEREEKERKEREERERQMRIEIEKNKRNTEESLDDTEFISIEEFTVPEDVCEWEEEEIPDYFMTKGIWDPDFGLLSEKVMSSAKDFCDEEILYSIYELEINVDTHMCDVIDVNNPEYFVPTGICQIVGRDFQFTKELSQTVDPHSTETIEDPQEKCQITDVEPSEYFVPAGTSQMSERHFLQAKETSETIDAESTESIEVTEEECRFTDVEPSKYSVPAGISQITERGFLRTKETSDTMDSKLTESIDISEEKCQVTDVEFSQYSVPAGMSQITERCFLRTKETSDTIDTQSTESIDVSEEKCQVTDVEFSKYFVPEGKCRMTEPDPVLEAKETILVKDDQKPQKTQEEVIGKLEKESDMRETSVGANQKENDLLRKEHDAAELSTPKIETVASPKDDMPKTGAEISPKEKALEFPERNLETVKSIKDDEKHSDDVSVLKNNDVVATSEGQKSFKESSPDSKKKSSRRSASPLKRDAEKVRPDVETKEHSVEERNKDETSLKTNDDSCDKSSEKVSHFTKDQKEDSKGNEEVSPVIKDSKMVEDGSILNRTQKDNIRSEADFANVGGSDVAAKKDVKDIQIAGPEKNDSLVLPDSKTMRNGTERSKDVPDETKLVLNSEDTKHSVDAKHIESSRIPDAEPLVKFRTPDENYAINRRNSDYIEEERETIVVVTDESDCKDPRGVKDKKSGLFSSFKRMLGISENESKSSAKQNKKDKGKSSDAKLKKDKKEQKISEDAQKTDLKQASGTHEDKQMGNINKHPSFSDVKNVNDSTDDSAVVSEDNREEVKQSVHLEKMTDVDDSDKKCKELSLDTSISKESSVRDSVNSSDTGMGADSKEPTADPIPDLISEAQKKDQSEEEKSSSKPDLENEADEKQKIPNEAVEKDDTKFESIVKQESEKNLDIDSMKSIIEKEDPRSDDHQHNSHEGKESEDMGKIESDKIELKEEKRESSPTIDTADDLKDLNSRLSKLPPEVGVKLDFKTPPPVRAKPSEDQQSGDDRSRSSTRERSPSIDKAEHLVGLQSRFNVLPPEMGEKMSFKKRSKSEEPFNDTVSDAWSVSCTSEDFDISECERAPSPGVDEADHLRGLNSRFTLLPPEMGAKLQFKKETPLEGADTPTDENDISVSISLDEDVDVRSMFNLNSTENGVKVDYKKKAPVPLPKPTTGTKDAVQVPSGQEEASADSKDVSAFNIITGENISSDSSEKISKSEQKDKDADDNICLVSLGDENIIGESTSVQPEPELSKKDVEADAELSNDAVEKKSKSKTKSYEDDDRLKETKLDTFKRKFGVQTVPPKPGASPAGRRQSAPSKFDIEQIQAKNEEDIIKMEVMRRRMSLMSTPTQPKPKPKSKKELDFLITLRNTTEEKKRLEREELARKERELREDRERREREERARKAQEEKERKAREEEEERLRRERAEQLLREQEAKLQKELRERRERERLEMEERKEKERKEKEEMAKREKEQRKMRRREEREKIEREEREREEREEREKQELIKRAKEIEEREEREEREKKEREEREEREKNEREERERIEREERVKREREDREKREREEKEKKEREEEERRIIEMIKEKERIEREVREEREAKEKEKREREERVAKRMEEMERELREEKERRKKMEAEIEERSKKLETEEQEKKEKEERETKEKEEREKREREEAAIREQEEKERWEREEIVRKEQEERERIERKKKEVNERERREREEKEREEKERLAKIEKERRMKEAEEKLKRQLEEKKERLEKERKEKEEKERKEREEKLRIEREEKERKEREEKERKEREEKAKREKEEELRVEREEKEKKEREEKERIEKENKEREEKARVEREEKERQEKERVEKEEKEKKEKEEKVRIEREEKERQVREEKERVEREDKEKKEKEEKVRLEREEKERQVREEKERKEKESEEKVKVDREEKNRKDREEKERAKVDLKERKETKKREKKEQGQKEEKEKDERTKRAEEEDTKIQRTDEKESNREKKELEEKEVKLKEKREKSLDQTLATKNQIEDMARITEIAEKPETDSSVNRSTDFQIEENPLVAFKDSVKDNISEKSSRKEKEVSKKSNVEDKTNKVSNDVENSKSLQDIQRTSDQTKLLGEEDILAKSAKPSGVKDRSKNDSEERQSDSKGDKTRLNREGKETGGTTSEKKVRGKGGSDKDSKKKSSKVKYTEEQFNDDVDVNSLVKHQPSSAVSVSTRSDPSNLKMTDNVVQSSGDKAESRTKQTGDFLVEGIDKTLAQSSMSKSLEIRHSDSGLGSVMTRSLDEEHFNYQLSSKGATGSVMTRSLEEDYLGYQKQLSATGAIEDWLYNTSFRAKSPSSVESRLKSGSIGSRHSVNTEDMFEDESTQSFPSNVIEGQFDDISSGSGTRSRDTSPETDRADEASVESREGATGPGQFDDADDTDSQEEGTQCRETKNKDDAKSEKEKSSSDIDLSGTTLKSREFKGEDENSSVVKDPRGSVDDSSSETLANKSKENDLRKIAMKNAEDSLSPRVEVVSKDKSSDPRRESIIEVCKDVYYNPRRESAFSDTLEVCKEKFYDPRRESILSDTIDDEFFDVITDSPVRKRSLTDLTESPEDRDISNKIFFAEPELETVGNTSSPHEGCSLTEVETSKNIVSEDLGGQKSGLVSKMFSAEMLKDMNFDSAEEFTVSQDACNFTQVEVPEYFVSSGTGKKAERSLLLTEESTQTIEPQSTEKYELPQEKTNFVDVEPSKYLIPADIWNSILLQRHVMSVAESLDHRKAESAEIFESPQKTCAISEVESRAVMADILELDVRFRDETPEERAEREREEQERLQREIRENEERIEKELKERKEKERKEMEERAKQEREEFEIRKREERRTKRREERERQEREEKEKQEREEKEKKEEEQRVIREAREKERKEKQRKLEEKERKRIEEEEKKERKEIEKKEREEKRRREVLELERNARKEKERKEREAKEKKEREEREQKEKEEKERLEREATEREEQERQERIEARRMERLKKEKEEKERKIREEKERVELEAKEKKEEEERKKKEKDESEKKEIEKVRIEGEEKEKKDREERERIENVEREKKEKEEKSVKEKGVREEKEGNERKGKEQVEIEGEKEEIEERERLAKAKKESEERLIKKEKDRQEKEKRAKFEKEKKEKAIKAQEALEREEREEKERANRRMGKEEKENEMQRIDKDRKERAERKARMKEREKKEREDKDRKEPEEKRETGDKSVREGGERDVEERGSVVSKMSEERKVRDTGGLLRDVGKKDKVEERGVVASKESGSKVESERDDSANEEEGEDESEEDRERRRKKRALEFLRAFNDDEDAKSLAETNENSSIHSAGSDDSKKQAPSQGSDHSTHSSKPEPTRDGTGYSRYLLRRRSSLYVIEEAHEGSGSEDEVRGSSPTEGTNEEWYRRQYGLQKSIEEEEQKAEEKKIMMKQEEEEDAEVERVLAAAAAALERSKRWSRELQELQEQIGEHSEPRKNSTSAPTEDTKEKEQSESPEKSTSVPTENTKEEQKEPQKKLKSIATQNIEEGQTETLEISTPVSAKNAEEEQKEPQKKLKSIATQNIEEGQIETLKKSTSIPTKDIEVGKTETLKKSTSIPTRDIEEGQTETLKKSTPKEDIKEEQKEPQKKLKSIATQNIEEGQTETLKKSTSIPTRNIEEGPTETLKKSTPISPKEDIKEEQKEPQKKLKSIATQNIEEGQTKTLKKSTTTPTRNIEEGPKETLKKSASIPPKEDIKEEPKETLKKSTPISPKEDIKEGPKETMKKSTSIPPKEDVKEKQSEPQRKSATQSIKEGPIETKKSKSIPTRNIEEGPKATLKKSTSTPKQNSEEEQTASRRSRLTRKESTTEDVVFVDAEGEALPLDNEADDATFEDAVDNLDTELKSPDSMQIVKPEEKRKGKVEEKKKDKKIIQIVKPKAKIVEIIDGKEVEEEEKEEEKGGKKGNSCQALQVVKKGGFAKCYEVIEQGKPKEVLACKIVPKAILVKSHQRDKMFQEINIHRSLHHKNIVTFFSFFEDDHFIYILLELCRRRSLMEMHKRRRAITEPETQYFVKQVVEACQYLHNRKVIHRDLKLGNLFLGEDLDVKIGDFGLATTLDFEGERKRTLCGTPNYIAPEVLSKKGHSFEVDVWSLGCIVYTLLVGKPPFETSSLKETYSKIKKNEYDIPSYVSWKARSLIQKLLKANPNERPSMDQIIKHEFFSGPIPTRLPASCLSIRPRIDTLCKQDVDIRKPLANVKLQDGGIRSCGEEKENVALKNEQMRASENAETDQSHLHVLNKLLDSVINGKNCDRECFEEDLEDPAAIPLYWVSKWVDYSDKYGIGYMLCDNSFGVLFNDSTRLILMANVENMEYIERDGAEKYFTMTNFPESLTKKVTLLKYFRNYMSEHLLKAGANITPRDSDDYCRLPFLKTWFRTRSAINLHLSNGTVQINFFEDHTKLILCPVMGAVTYIDEKRNCKTYRVQTLQKFGSTKDLYYRLRYAKNMVDRLITSKMPLRPKVPSTNQNAANTNTATK